MEIDILNNRINSLIADKDYTERQYESLKKVYNDLAESHAKQVIEIEAMRLRLVEATNCEHDSAKILSLESELLKAKELLTRAVLPDRTQHGKRLLNEVIEEFLNKK